MVAVQYHRNAATAAIVGACVIDGSASAYQRMKDPPVTSAAPAVAIGLGKNCRPHGSRTTRRAARRTGRRCRRPGGRGTTSRRWRPAGPAPAVGRPPGGRRRRTAPTRWPVRSSTPNGRSRWSSADAIRYALVPQSEHRVVVGEVRRRDRRRSIAGRRSSRTRRSAGGHRAAAARRCRTRTVPRTPTRSGIGRATGMATRRAGARRRAARPVRGVEARPGRAPPPAARAPVDTAAAASRRPLS